MILADLGDRSLEFHGGPRRPRPRDQRLASTGVLRTLDSSTAMASVFRLRPCVAARFFKA
jgi:hypothetical protein